MQYRSNYDLYSIWTAQQLNHIIGISTRDSNDVSDVMRVREELRRMGFTEKLPYKTEAARAAGEKTNKFFC